MKKLLLGTFTLALLIATSLGQAADLPGGYRKAPPPAPPPLYNWTGFYLGGNVGYSWGNSQTDMTFRDTGTILFGSSTRFKMDGAVGGGQIGYNYQTGNIVWGIESDVQATDQAGSATFICPGAICSPRPGLAPPGPVLANINQRLEWFGTIRGRVGVTVIPTVLLYVTGGLAYGEVNTNGTLSGFDPVPVLPEFVVSTTLGTNDLRTGWTVGAGIETALWGNWAGKVEYLYIDLGSLAGTGANLAITPPIAINFSSHILDNIVRVGLNYRWGPESAPIVARY
jgi:outer membrane immunogenic protein